MTNTRRRASNGVRAAAATTGSSMSPTSISCAPLGVDPGQVGMDAVLHARAGAVGVGGALGEQLGGERARDVALARSRPGRGRGRRGWPPVGRQRGGQDRAGVGVALGAGGSTSGRLRRMRGRLITIEGLDGAGKTTLADGPRRGAGAPAGADVELLREPGGVELSERIRDARQGPGAAGRPARRGAALRGRARAAVRRAASRRCSTPGAGCCSTASSTPRSPTRAPGAGWGSTRSARSTTSPPAASSPTARCCCASTPARAARAGRARRGAGPPRARGRRVLRRDRRGLRRARRGRARRASACIDASARARRGPRRRADGARRPPTIGRMTRGPDGDSVRLRGARPAGDGARPEHDGAGDDEQPPIPGERPNRRSRRPDPSQPDDRPRAGDARSVADDGPVRDRADDERPGRDPARREPTTAPAATRPGRHGRTAAADDDVRQRPRGGRSCSCSSPRSLVLALGAVARRPLAGLGPAVARALASRHRRGRLARGQRVGRVHRLDAPRALSRRLSPSPARSRTPSSRRSPWRPCRRR